METLQQNKNFSFVFAKTNEQYEQAKKLVLQYASSLNVDLSFQGFQAELQSLSQQYAAPTGAMLLAYHQNEPVACVALRKLDDLHAELKRMFVLPEYRGYKISGQLLELIIKKAGELGYKKIRLDTLPDMTRAQNIYIRFGFYKIPSYRFNPVPGTVYMEKEL
jgi:ribosomal protein S18 acetylase RimI-like enzyme